MIDSAIIAERRQAIQDDAPCVGCGSSLVDCVANRGKDPTAPSWFGCCALTMTMDPCRHTPSTSALLNLIKEIESGKVRTLAETLLDQIEERPRSIEGLRRIARGMTVDEMRGLIHPSSWYAQEE